MNIKIQNGLYWPYIRLTKVQQIKKKRKYNLGILKYTPKAILLHKK